MKTPLNIALSFLLIAQPGFSKPKENKKVTNLLNLSLQTDDKKPKASPHALTLSDAFKRAYETDSKIAAVGADYEASQHHFDADHAKAWGPQLGLTAGLVYGSKWITPSPAFPVVNGWTLSGGLSLVQPLFNYVQILQADQSEYAISVAEVRNAVAQQDLMVRVTKAYLDVLKLQNSIEYKTLEIEAAKTHLEIVKEQFDVGLATLVDVSEAEAIVSATEGQKASLESTLITAKGVLLQTWQIEAEELKHLKAKVKFEGPTPADPKKWIDQAVSLNLNVQYTNGLMEIAQYDIEKVKAALYYPTVNLTAGCSAQGTSPYPFGSNQTSTDTCSAGVTLNIPLFDGGYTPAKTKEATSIKERIRNDLRTAQIVAAQSARQSYADIQKELGNIALYQNSVDKMAEALLGKREQYIYGERKSFEILTTLQNLNLYKQQLLNEKYDLIYNMIVLKQSVGLLSVVDLESIDALLE